MKWFFLGATVILTALFIILLIWVYKKPEEWEERENGKHVKSCPWSPRWAICSCPRREGQEKSMKRELAKRVDQETTERNNVMKKLNQFYNQDAVALVKSAKRYNKKVKDDS